MLNETKRPGYVIEEGYDYALAIESVGSGWSNLLWDVFKLIEHHNSTSSDKIIIVQVKEKWGGLRIYTNYSILEIDKFLMETEKKSFRICEECGAIGNLRKLNGTYKTRCEIHANGAIIIEGE